MNWLHWEEQVINPDDRLMPYHAGCSFTANISEDDSFSAKAEEYLGISVEPAIQLDLSGILLEFQHDDHPEAVLANHNMDIRELCKLYRQIRGTPPNVSLTNSQVFNFTNAFPEMQVEASPNAHAIYIVENDNPVVPITLSGGPRPNYDYLQSRYPRAYAMFERSGIDVRSIHLIEGAVAKQWTSAAPANWSAIGAWTPGGAPNAGDDIDFTNSTQTCTVDSVNGNMATCDITVEVLVTCNVNLTFTGAFAQSAGTFTPNTTSVAMQSTLTITGGTCGGNSSYGLDLDGNFSLTTPGIFNAPNTINKFSMAGATFTFTSGTYNTDNGEITFDRAGTTTLGANSPPFYDVTINVGAILNTSAASNFSLSSSNSMALDGVLTCNSSTCSFTGTGTGSQYSIEGAGTFTGGGGTHTVGSLYASGGTWTFTSGTMTINNVEGSGGLIALAISTVTFDDGNGTVTFTRAGAQKLWSTASTARILYNVTVNHASCALSHYAGSLMPLTVANLLTITAGSLTSWDGTTSASLTVQSGANIVGTLDCKAATCSFTGTGSTGGYSLYVSGTFTGGSGTHTMGSIRQESGGTSLTFTSGTTTINNVKSGATICWAIGGTWDDGNGTIAFTYAGAQTLYSDSNTARILYNLTVNNASCALSYFAGSSFALTVANLLTITAGSFTSWDGTVSAGLTVQSGCNVTGTLDCKAATCSFTGIGSTNLYSIDIDGTFTGGSGTHTFGSVYIGNSPANATFTSGNSTINNTASGATNALYWRATCTWDDGNGTIIFTYAGAQTIWSQSNTARILYNLTINNASCALTYGAANSFTTTVANNLTITAGSFTTWDGTVSASLTVTAKTAVNGTLDCKASTFITGSGSTADWGLYMNGGTFAGGSGTHTIGSIDFDDGTNTVTMSSGTTTVNSNYAGYSFVTPNAGSFAHNNGTVGFTYAGTATLYGRSNTLNLFYNVIINHASCILKPYSNTQVAHIRIGNNLTVTLGTLNTIDSTTGTTSFNLTVTNATSLAGTLTCNASTVSLGSGALVTNGSLSMNGGVFTGGSGTHTIGSIDCLGASTLTLSSGTTTIDAVTAGGWSFLQRTAGNVINHGSGTVNFTYTGGVNVVGSATTGQSLTLNNVGINVSGTSMLFAYTNPASTFTTTVAGTLTVTAGVLQGNTLVANSTSNITVTGTTSITGSMATAIASGETLTCTFNSAVTVNSGGVLGGNIAYTTSLATIDVKSGGAFSAPNASGSCTCTASGNYWFRAAGVFTNNSGTVTCSGADMGFQITGANPFYNVTVTSGQCSVGALTIQNILTVSTSSGASTYISANNTLTMGTVSAAGSIVVGSGKVFNPVLAATDVNTVQAASASYLCVCTGDDWNWNYAAGTTNVKWLDYRIDATTGGGGCTVIFTGDMTIDGFTLSIGDTLTCTTAGTTITKAAGSDLFNRGTLTLTGTSGSHITCTGGRWYYSYVTCNTLSMSYVDTTGTIGIDLNNAPSSTFSVSNCTFTGTGGTGVNANAGTYTFSSCTFIGPEGTWYDEDLRLNTGAQIQCDTCTFTTVGMQATSGWLVSKDGSSNFTIYGILDSSETPSAGYRAANVTGSFTLKNADLYSTSFNSSYTLGAAMTSVTTMTISASTTFNTSAASSYALTTSSNCSLPGTLTCNASTISIASTKADSTTAGLTINTGGTLTGGSGTHTYGSVSLSGGIWTATSGNTTINGYQQSSASPIIFSSGTFTHSNGTVIFTYSTGGAYNILFYLNPSFYNFTLNPVTGGLGFWCDSAGLTCIVTNNLTITTGTLNTRYASQPVVNLTVTNVTSITGTLTCNASTVSLGSAVADSVTINAGGTLTGGSGTHTYGSMQCNGNDTATFTASSGNTTINGTGTNGRVWFVRGTRFTHSSGTLIFNPANASQGITRENAMSYATTFNNVQISNTITWDATGTAPGTSSCTVAGTLTVDASKTLNGPSYAVADGVTITGATTINGTYSPQAGSTFTMTFNGAVAVNSGGILGANIAWTFDMNTTCTTAVGGTFSAPNASGSWLQNGDFDMSGTLTNNTGTCTCDGTTDFGPGVVNKRYNNITVANGVTASDSIDIFIDGLLTVGTSATATFSFNATWTYLTGTNNYSVYTGSTVDGAGTCAISGGGNLSSVNFTCGGLHIFNNNYTVTGNIVYNRSTGSFYSYTEHSTSYTVAVSTYTITVTSTNTHFGQVAVSAGTINWTFTTGSLTSTHTGTLAIGGTGLNTTVVGSNTAWTFDCNGPTIIGSTGTISAPNATGTWNFSGTTLTVDGAITTNSGTLTLDATANNSQITATTPTSTDVTLYNLTNATTGRYGLTYLRTLTVQNTFTISSGTYLLQVATILTIGTASSAGSIVNNASFITGNNAPATCSVVGASSSYKATCSGTAWGFNADSYTTTLKWLVFQMNLTTGTGYTPTVSITGDLTFQQFIVPTGTLSCTTASTTITWADVSGAGFGGASLGQLTSTGTAGNNVVWKSASDSVTNHWNADFGGSMTMHYTTFQFHTDAHCGGSGKTLHIDYCTFDTSSSTTNPGIGIVAGTTVDSFTNNTISNSGGWGFINAASNVTFSNLTISTGNTNAFQNSGSNVTCTSCAFTAGVTYDLYNTGSVELRNCAFGGSTKVYHAGSGYILAKSWHSSTIDSNSNRILIWGGTWTLAASETWGNSRELWSGGSTPITVLVEMFGEVIINRGSYNLDIIGLKSGTGENYALFDAVSHAVVLKGNPTGWFKFRNCDIRRMRAESSANVQFLGVIYYEDMQLSGRVEVSRSVQIQQRGDELMALGGDLPDLGIRYRQIST